VIVGLAAVSTLVFFAVPLILVILTSLWIFARRRP